MMKYKVRLYEKKLVEIAPLATIKRYLTNPEGMQKIINSPSGTMTSGVTDPNKNSIPITSPKDIINALIKFELLPEEIRTEINNISKFGLKGLKGSLKVQPTHGVQRAIEEYLKQHPTINSFLNVFVPGTEGGAKSPEAIQGSIERLKPDPTSSSSDVYKNA